MTTKLDKAVKLGLELLEKYKGKVDVALPHFNAMLRKQLLLDTVVEVFLRRIDAGEVGLRSAEGPVPPREPPRAGPKDTDPTIDVSQYKVPAYKRRTTEQRAAYEEAKALSADAIWSMRINGSLLGNLRMGNLRTLARETAIVAGRGLQEGLEETEQALLLQKMAGYGIPASTNATVRETIPLAAALKMQAEAQKEAPHLIIIGMKKYAETVLTIEETGGPPAT